MDVAFSFFRYQAKFASMESKMSWKSAKALLGWQLEMGVDEAIVNAPVNRYALNDVSKISKKIKHTKVINPIFGEIDPIKVATEAASKVDNVEDLRKAIDAFEHCELKLGARNLVFSDGHPTASVMIIGEAPGREEDKLGKPFVGRAGQLLDRMLAAIDLDRKSEMPKNAVYITNVLPWRPPLNREPKANEIAMLWPFVEKHISLIAPKIVLPMGNIACQALLGERGITRLRGKMQHKYQVDILPMYHPAYLLRTPVAKQTAWQDLLQLRAWMRGK